MRRVLLFALVGGLLIALLRALEYSYFVHAYPGEIYGGVVAVLFTAVGLHLGRRWRHPEANPAPPPATAASEAAAPATAPPPPSPPAPSAALAGVRERLGITPREHEILRLIAEGLSNREIGERAFISENTVKTHSSRLFAKLGAVRRVQAVQRARELGLLP